MTRRWIHTAAPAIMAGFALACFAAPALAAQATTPPLPGTPQQSNIPATPQVPNSGVRYNNTSTWNSNGGSQSSGPLNPATLGPATNSALAPQNSPTQGPGASGRDPDPGPSSRGKAYNVRPIPY